MEARKKLIAKSEEYLKDSNQVIVTFNDGERKIYDLSNQELFEISSVKIQNPHFLILQFKNLELKIYDVSFLLDKPIFKFLNDIEELKKVKILDGGRRIAWIDQEGEVIDLCADSLYFKSVIYEKNETNER